jgi:quercetin dioxygenase-like cupin family protein
MRVFVLGMVVAVGAASVAWSAAAQAPQGGAPAGPDPANFTGKVTPHATTDIRLLRYSFEPAARTNWHSHEGGQVIVIEKGRMRAQERGAAAKEFGPRDTYVVAPSVEHWHGALPGEPLTQVALSYGATKWLKPVTDAEYASAARK